MSIVLLLIFGCFVSLWDMCMLFSSAHMQDKRLVLVTYWSSRAQEPGQEAVLLFRLAAVKAQSSKHFPGSPHSCSNKKAHYRMLLYGVSGMLTKQKRKKKYDTTWIAKCTLKLKQTELWIFFLILHLYSTPKISLLWNFEVICPLQVNPMHLQNLGLNSMHIVSTLQVKIIFHQSC